MPWTNITNAQLAVGAPIRSVDLLALRDNITAQANGDPGAPKQQAAGINFNTNGLQNSAGALAIACPGFNTVGSYCGGFIYLDSYQAFTSGTNLAAGSGNRQVRSATIIQTEGGTTYSNTVNLSGTWRFMGSNCDTGYTIFYVLLCRVS